MKKYTLVILCASLCISTNLFCWWMSKENLFTKAEVAAQPSIMTLKQKKTCNKLIPFWEKFVEMPESKHALLHHVIFLFDVRYSRELEKRIQREGLLSTNEIIRRGEPLTRKTFVDHAKKNRPNSDYNDLSHEYDSIYFVPQRFFKENKLADHFCPTRIVRYLVNKDKYPLYNSYLRGPGMTDEIYFASKIHIDSKEYPYLPEAFVKGQISPKDLIFYYPVTSSDFKGAKEDEEHTERDKRFALEDLKKDKERALKAAP